MTPEQRQRLRDAVADTVRAKLMMWDAEAVIEGVLDTEINGISLPIAEIASEFDTPESVTITDATLDYFIERINS